MADDKDIGVKHLLDGKDAWKLGVLGFFTRLRGQITASVMSVLMMGQPFWWSDKMSKDIKLRTDYFIISVILIVTSVLIVGFLVYRNFAIRQLKLRASQHGLTHYLRDSISAVYKRTSGTDGKPRKVDPRSEAQHISNFSEMLCQKISEHFSYFSGSDSIDCSIRLAHEYPNGESKKLMYKTVGRSSGLNEKRKNTSEPVPFDAGIPNFFRSSKPSCQGILYYTDLDKAIANQAFLKTSNEDNFPNEIKSMLVAPLNGWDGNSESMFGILYISSRYPNAFSEKHVDAVKSLADLIAGTFVAMLARLHSVKSLPALSNLNI